MQPTKRKAKGYADGGIIGISPRSRERIDAAERAALGQPQPTPAPTPPAPEAPKPQDPGWIARAKSALGFKDGGKVKCAAGGKVTGPGTSRSDSIPARLSNGEYVLPADTAKKVGYGNLDALKARTHTTPMQRKLMARK